jgi:hypothetical protein
LLVEIRIAVQRDSQHCFHAQVYCSLNWFITTWPLHLGFLSLLKFSSLFFFFSIFYQ